MGLAKYSLLLSFLLSANADIGLRGTTESKPFTCSVSGSSSQNKCDSTTDDDGSNCVWCSLSSFGFCVTESQAETMKKSLPGIECDDKGDDDNAPSDDDMDDDAAPSNDDKAPSNDDNTPSNDDNAPVPDDYWTCLKEYKDSKSCLGAGCSWCDTKAGYGICMDKDAAEANSNSAWFTCHNPSDLELKVSDPYDTSCLIASMQGDEATCEGTTDQSGQPCEWCAISSVQLCLTSDQAGMAEEFGAQCGKTNSDENKQALEDRYDTSCLMATLQGDESTCASTMDQDGHPCEWCALSSINLCMTAEQAELAQQVGADCTPPSIEADEEPLGDPYDRSCLMASLQQDAASCASTTDLDGHACEWCPLASMGLCLTSEQVDVASRLGLDCGAAREEEEAEEDPIDVPDDFFKCLSKSKSSDACTDASCTVCKLEYGSSICLSDAAVEAVKDSSFFDCSSKALTEPVESPLDPQCLAAGIGADDAEAACDGTMDADGNPCVWCDAAGAFGFCMSAEQASIANRWLECKPTIFSTTE